MKGLNGKGVAENWAILFQQNERLAKRGKALSDEMLKLKMYEQFPASVGRTTIERVKMVRADYNAARGMFAGVSAKERVLSSRYADGRTPVPQRQYKRKRKK